ncbi:unnamed protein product [Rotaria sp. Silwood2]|nr:unnamed protein product [Rotaria sp. Silwood2]
MQVFEQIFNLCTLYDLAPLIVKFLKVNKYEDAHLGPLDEHPTVKRVFKYKPIQRQVLIPEITSEEIIHAFVEFQQSHQRRKFLYEDFIDELVQEYQLEKREQLGLFCRSFPYLSKVTRKLTQEWNRCDKRFVSDDTRSIINEVEDKLREIKQEVKSGGNVFSTINETSFSNLSSSSYETRSPVSLQDICSDLFNILVRFDSVLTIKQLYEIQNYLCKKYSIKNFSEFRFNDNDDDDENNYLDLISFIHKHRDKIDPHGDLSIYEYISSTGDRQEIYTFVNQLTMIKN